jgi:ABC-type transport system substrate-binding protein
MLKSSVFLIAASLALTIFLVACGGAGEDTTPGESAPASDQSQPATAVPAPAAARPTVVATATPRPTNTPSAAQEITEVAGRLRIATVPPVQQLVESWLGTTTSANTQVRPFTDPLVHTDRFDGSLVPGLATSWEASEDGTQWTFHLRDDVEFQRGWGTFSAHDVPHSTGLISMEDAIASDTGIYRQLFGETYDEVLENVVALDDSTVQFNVLVPNSIVDFFATAQQGNQFMYSLAQFEAEGLEGYNTLPAGVGPWQFEERTLDVNLLYSRVEDHWRRTPFFQELEWVLIPEENTRLAQLKTGQVQVGEVSRELHADAIGSGLKVVQSELPSYQVSFIIGGVFNPEVPNDCADGGERCFYQPDEPHLDPRVREAINRALNRDEINEQLFAGIGQPHVVWGYHPALPGWNPRWLDEFDEKYGFDPERARQLLEESGHLDYKLKILLTELPGVPEMIPMGEAAYTYLSNVGIDVESEAIEWSTYRANYYRPGRTHGTIAATRGTYRPAEITVRSYNRSGPTGFWRTSVDPRTDSLYDLATRSMDPQAKHDALQELGDLKFDLYSEAPIVWLPAQVLIDPEVIGEYVWPGNINASFTHTEYITPAR